MHVLSAGPNVLNVRRQALKGATGGAIAAADVADCTIFLPSGTSVTAAKAVERAVTQATSGSGTAAPAALTMVELGLVGAPRGLLHGGGSQIFFMLTCAQY